MPAQGYPDADAVVSKVDDAILKTDAILSKDEVYAIAHRIHKTPFDKVKESSVTVPKYNGLSTQLSQYLSPNPPAGYKTPARQVRPAKNQIANSVLDLVGNTPMVRLDRLRKVLDVEPELLGCEYFSAG